MLSKIILVLLVLSIKGILKLSEVLLFKFSFFDLNTNLLTKSFNRKGFLIICISISSYLRNVSISNCPLR